MESWGTLSNARQAKRHCLSSFDTKERRIAWDFDDTIAPTMQGMITYLNAERGTNLDYEKFSDPDLRLNFGLSETELLALLSEYCESPYFLNNAPHPDTAAVMDAVKKFSGAVDMHIVTVQPYELRNHLEEYLDKYLPGRISEVHHRNSPFFRSCGNSKGGVCKRIGAPVIVDDNPGHLESCLRDNIGVFMPKTPWNMQVERTGPTLVEVFGFNPSTELRFVPLRVSSLAASKKEMYK